ncbi:hypothetical protein K1T71_004426 [Dendrolimus kikuchii]|uniref:Uncharacterized protein n=1 Tax=Dendrolimus kikuchii TaxID=765133 RepID=A0ACC1D7K6_9NEOP|nr:hypothetical protein K1T71_004426 [Dendrolimus kikuchii]
MTTGRFLAARILVDCMGCEPVSVWTIIRHGKRNPSRYFAKKMKEALPIRDSIISSYEKGNSSICSQDIEYLRKWPINEKMFDGVDILSEDGFKEMVGIGSRLKETFSKLLTNGDDKNYTIKAAYGNRMKDSAKGFVQGLNSNITKILESNSDFDELAPYATCGKYQHDVKNSSQTYAEEIKYLNAKDFVGVKNGLQKRLGISYNLTDDNTIALYDLCRYTWSGYENNSSPWCALFTIDDLKVLEYDGDLRHYYRNGYGRSINKLFGKIPLADLLKRFQDSRNGKGKKLTGYITHATMMDMIYTSLGLFEDKEPLVGVKLDPNRKWRSTFMSAFGANIISVLYRCNNGTGYKVGFYSNEMLLNSICSNGICTWEEFEIIFNPFLNSNTDFFRGDLRDSIIKLQGCEPISIWSLIRHGKNNPGGNFTKLVSRALSVKEDIIASYDNGNSSLCAQDMENLRRWSLDRTMIEKSDQLAKEGYEEMYELGVRLKRVFGKLLQNLDKDNYMFKPASGDVIHDSAKAFVKGLGYENVLIDKSKTGYDIIAPYVSCEKYQKDVMKNPLTYDNVIKYKHSPAYFVTKDRFQRRLGIEYDLTDEDLEMIYDLCSYVSSGIDNKLSPWCALFTTGDLITMEYIGDLQSYYKNSYGNPINEILGRIPLTDLLESFRDAKAEKGQKIKAYFTDATTVNMAITALNLFKDVKPLSGKEKDPARQWKTSRLSAFSSNLMAVLNRCKADGEETDYNVIFYWNEEPIRSICEHGVCPWQEFEDKLKPFLNTSTEIC